MSKVIKPQLGKTDVGSSALQIASLSDLWVCINDKNEPNYGTISTTKSGSIKELTSMLKIHEFSKWSFWKRKGYKCIKVNISFLQVNNSK